MPVEEGKSREIIGKNISEIMRSYKKKKRIGNIHPKSAKKAREIAAAIAYRKSRE